MTPISLAHLTVLDMAPPQMIRLAARLGYDRVGLRLIRVTDASPGYPLHNDPAALLPFLAAGATLGARHIICAPYDPELQRLSDSLASLPALARPFGLSAVLEFFPWTKVPDLATARAVVDRTGMADIGILIDTLHFNRSGSALADLERLPHARLPFLHLCDAPVRSPYTTEALLHAGRAERLPPGQGQIDLAAILSRLPQGLPVAVEVPMTRLQAERGSAEVAALVLAATRDLLGRLGRA